MKRIVLVAAAIALLPTAARAQMPTVVIPKIGGGYIVQPPPSEMRMPTIISPTVGGGYLVQPPLSDMRMPSVVTPEEQEASPYAPDYPDDAAPSGDDGDSDD